MFVCFASKKRCSNDGSESSQSHNIDRVRDLLRIFQLINALQTPLLEIFALKESIFKPYGLLE